MDREKIVLLAVVLGLTVPYLFINVKNLIFPEVIFLAILTVRFLAGFGIFSSYAIFVVYLFKYLSDFFKRKKRESMLVVKYVNFFAFLILLALIVWSILMWNSKVSSISSVIGISLFIIGMYIIPMWKEEKIDETILDKVKDVVVKGIKKGYYKYFTKEYLKAYSLEYLTFRAKLDAQRKRWAFIITPLLVLLAFPIASLMLIIVYFSYKLYRNDVSAFDRYLFISGLIAILFIQFTVLSEIAIPSALWNIPYLIGAAISFYIYFKTFVR